MLRTKKQHFLLPFFHSYLPSSTFNFVSSIFAFLSYSCSLVFFFIYIFFIPFTSFIFPSFFPIFHLHFLVSSLSLSLLISFFIILPVSFYFSLSATLLVALICFCHFSSYVSCYIIFPFIPVFLLCFLALVDIFISPLHFYLYCHLSLIFIFLFDLFNLILSFLFFLVLHLHTCSSCMYLVPNLFTLLFLILCSFPSNNDGTDHTQTLVLNTVPTKLNGCN